MTSLEAQPIERATISMSVDFTILENDEEVHIGGRRDEITFLRGGDGTFEIDERLSTATPKQVESFYENLDSDHPTDDFLKFNLRGLLKVAKGSGEKARAWVLRFIRRCSDSTELRQVQIALAAPR